MSSLFRHVPSFLVLLLTAASAPASGSVPAIVPSARLVTQEELESSRQSNLLDFVRTHRPQWLRNRGAVGMTVPQVVVFLDGQRIGGVEQLSGISTEITASLRYLDWREGTTRWGAGHGSGAIMVTTGPLAAEIRDRATRADWLPE